MPHNMDTYLEAYSLFEGGENMVGITQATGTGKTYLLAQFLYDFCYRLKTKGPEDEQKPIRSLIIAPSRPLLSQTGRKLYNTLGPNLKNITATTYSELLTVTDEDLAQHFDFIAIDEFHRLGAEKWGPAVQKILDANPNAKILGLTATPVRFLDEARDMGEEFFNGVVVQGPSIGEAIKLGILPKPKYVLGFYSYKETIKDLESAVNQCKDLKTKDFLETLLREAKREAINMESLEEIIARNIKEAEQTQGGGFVDGKYIAYCTDVNHSKEVIAQLPKLLSSTNKDIHIYTVNYTMGKEAIQEQINAFENDNSGAIKVMVAIHMFDEGFHLKGVKGVFCFSNTTSPNRHLQRIGRTLDADNQEHQPLIFDMVSNLSCLRFFGKSCASQSGENDADFNSDEYVSPFKDLPFDVDERTLTLAELLARLDFEVAKSRSPEQWIKLFEEYFNENPNATYIPMSEPTLWSKMDHLKRSYDNGQGNTSANEQKIIDWFISTGRENILLT
ncbi:MAG: DEAD/DEAH box helicase family protein, partial [Clostridia bacterium]|nr:DEAD/DEAH box helicase family protein [Clostridia bacterium]